ncbi:hypothetical protein ABZ366_01630 [Streptomyces sp. NPDC005904]|uniref:hypothetical protein n=1 Tax=Streptomyces sp. NPDC005904 TaxID=3154570 RepID=UPI0034030124
MTALVVAVSTAATSAAFTWWWSPIKASTFTLHWSEGEGFDNSGPVLVALTLCNLIGGAAIGMMLRRTLLSMVVALGFAIAVQVVWARFRLSPGSVLMATSHDGADGARPRVPDSAYIADSSYLTASGDLLAGAAAVRPRRRQPRLA